MSQILMPPSSDSGQPEEPAETPPGVTVLEVEAQANAAPGTTTDTHAQRQTAPVAVPLGSAPSDAPRPAQQQSQQPQWPQQMPPLQWQWQQPQAPAPQIATPPPGQPYPGYAQPGGMWPQPTPQPVQAPPYPGYPQVYPPTAHPLAQPGMTQPGAWPYTQPGYAQPAYAPAPPARSVVEAGGAGGWQGYEKPKQAFVWKIVKWPIKTLLKVIYLIGSAARRHRAVAVVLLLIIALFAAGAYGLYQATHPAAPATAGTGSSSTSQSDTTPFTIISGSQPPLSPGVITFLHGYKTFDGHQLWNSLSPDLQQTLESNGVSADQLNSDLQQEKQAGLAYTEFIYTGGFLSPDGTSHFTVEVVESLGTARAVRTWFFMTDTNDKVIDFQDLSPQPGQGG